MLGIKILKNKSKILKRNVQRKAFVVGSKAFKKKAIYKSD